MSDEPTPIPAPTHEDAPVKRKPGRPPKRAAELSVQKERQKRALRKMDGYKGDIERLLFRQIRAFEWAQDAWINAMTKGLNAKQEYLTKQDAQQGLQLATMLEKLVDTQGRYLKDQKAAGARLTEQELLAKAEERIMSLPKAQRREYLRRMVDGHNAEHNRGAVGEFRKGVEGLAAPGEVVKPPPIQIPAGYKAPAPDDEVGPAASALALLAAELPDE